MLALRRTACAAAFMTSMCVLAGGCGSSVDPLGPTVDVSLFVMTPAAESSTLHVSFGTRSVSLHDREGSVDQATTKIRGIGYGSVPVRFTLIGKGGDTLASASFTRDLQAHYSYGVAALVGASRLLGICSATVSAVPLRNSMGDSLFVDAVAIPKGAIC